MSLVSVAYFQSCFRSLLGLCLGIICSRKQSYLYAPSPYSSHLPKDQSLFGEYANQKWVATIARHNHGSLFARNLDVVKFHHALYVLKLVAAYSWVHLHEPSIRP